MQENQSYIFFRAEPMPDADEGPIGGAGLPLKALRAIAVDRGLWAYGTPFFIRGEIPWQKATPEAFARPMIALDTGSAIVGPSRVDLFFGSGDEAGARAGDIRHAADVIVLLPHGEEPHVGP
jgi:membrane-bound lytic murein transglycosylase A